ncbi:hypothetical protein M422DRAFT_267178 [Sphaerobolus stellatus SS14]|uniref:Uncharacterized protein n=1 Tax=Sphaerobolus stellatus (strain SS14) TaxID=990650 RepID=A0A0C9TMN0_SPHS4|nr:hypothetical protein M422DRAFT_267178 [Sphaerobolus stellatus SS14]
MHLLKTIVTTPQSDNFTCSVLQNLNFQPSSERFGIFFLPGLHLETLAVYQMEADSDPAHHFVTNLHGKHKERQMDFLEDLRYTSEYPLGTHPSWTGIMEILDSNPSVIVGPLRNINFWKDSPSTTNSLVIVLMAKWSRQYIFAMNQTFLADQGNYPLLDTWEDILRFWIITGIQSLVHAPAFQPHKSYWKGLPPGPQQATFAQRYKTFFPPLSLKFSTTSYWNYFLEYGYMKDYHDILRTNTEEEILNLTDSLKATFDWKSTL